MSERHSLRCRLALRAALGGLLAAAACGSTASAPAPDAGSDRGVSPVEAGRDGAADARGDGPTDAGVDADAPTATEGGCAPAQVSGWTPVPLQPSSLLHECTDAQIATLLSDCFHDNGQSAGCTAFLQAAANGNCVGCIFTAYSMTRLQPGHNPVPAANPFWGPEIEVIDTNGGGDIFPNIGGCIALADPSETECGEIFNDLLQCEIQACGANCTLDDPKLTPAQIHAADLGLGACISAAAHDVCSFYAHAAVRDCTRAMTGPASFCFSIQTSTDLNVVDSAYSKLFTLQCGGAVADAGGGPG